MLIISLVVIGERLADSCKLGKWPLKWLYVLYVHCRLARRHCLSKRKHLSLSNHYSRHRVTYVCLVNYTSHMLSTMISTYITSI